MKTTVGVAAAMMFMRASVIRYKFVLVVSCCFLYGEQKVKSEMVYDDDDRSAQPISYIIKADHLPSPSRDFTSTSACMCLRIRRRKPVTFIHKIPHCITKVGSSMMPSNLGNPAD
jgi:hypothetical protein